ncbi:hypothetical protein [Paenibacillus tarimensis]|uniref:hypothetical protein n=1 Tax=Paenibacillus tarimensis TaxID=416012 RepID=UPI001F1AAE9A|nr:hypothetical protein [Paenibacillus tarimensis]MCF2945827.1 hypothetical protein [Paenibacillus tarimensis]
MKLRNYLSSLVVAISSLPSQEAGRGLHRVPRTGEMDKDGRMPVLASSQHR